jgi:hypothetical protein
MNARLIYLGRAADCCAAPPSCLRVAARLAREGESIALQLKHAHRWTRADVTRVIIGSNPDRADVLLVDDPLTIGGEHVRFYLNHAAPSASHLRPMKNAVVLINGEPHQPFEWVNPKHGDEIQLGDWRFRFEVLD